MVETNQDWDDMDWEPSAGNDELPIDDDMETEVKLKKMKMSDVKPTVLRKI